MSNKVCCVAGCFNSTVSKDVLHRFPNPMKDRERFNTWLYFVGGEVLGLHNNHIFKYRRICHRHFEEKYWCRNNLLSKNAVPTLNMPGFSLPTLTSNERPPLASIENTSEASTSKGFSLPTLTSNERQPLTSIENTSEASTSKGPSIPKLLSKSTTDIQIKENIDTGIDMPHLNTLQAVSKVKEVSNTRSMCEYPNSRTTVVKRKRVLTESEKCLHKKLVHIGIKLSKFRNKIKKQAFRIKAMQNIVSHPQLLKTLDSWPSTARVLTMLQFRERKKGDKGRRFTFEEKIIALSIFKQSPRGYRFFRKIFILPSPQTLVKLIALADIRPGLNKNILSQIRKATQNIKNVQDRLCMLIFDEMSLKAHVSYNERKDRVSGFVTNGRETRQDLADHVQVFMIRGLIRNFKQPVYYSFSQAATKGPELAVQLKEIISALIEAGLIVVGTVCDQGTNNMNCIKLLMQDTRTQLLKKGEEYKHNVFYVNGYEVVPLYDPPHLIKCIRNNLITKDLKWESKTAKWDHITNLLNENPGYKGIRLIPNLTDFHCIPTKIPRQKVKYATQLFSRTVAINMGYLADKGILPKESKDTADAIMFFDELFDSVNGSYGKRKKHGKPLLGPATPNSLHHQVWDESKRILKNMKFVSKSEKKEYVPTLNNWVWTLEGIQHLIKILKEKYDVNSIWLRHLNQDPIENFFGSVRSHGCRNVNPSTENFESAYTTLLINSLSGVHAPGANCESDNCKALTNIIVTDSDCRANTVCELEAIPDITVTPLEDKNDPRKLGGLQYVSGYFLKNAKKKVFKNCVQCKKDLFTNEEIEYIKYREYSKKKTWLCSPSHALLKCVSSLQDITYCIIKENLEKSNLSEFIKTMIILYVDFDFINCEVHKENIINYLINISCRFFIFNYCKDINRILNNKRACDDDDDKFKVKAKKYFSKCFKRKNK